MTFNTFLAKVSANILTPIIELMFALATLVFFYGIFQSLQEGKEQERYKSSIWWGLVGMFIMLTVYGIIGLIKNTFDIQDSPNPTVNQILKGN